MQIAKRIRTIKDIKELKLDDFGGLVIMVVLLVTFWGTLMDVFTYKGLSEMKSK
jgi:hypothetical protein